MGLIGWRLALRIARREANRNRGRSALVIAMIAVPILGLTMADVVIRASDLDRGEIARRALGAADLSVFRVSEESITQTPSEYLEFSGTGTETPDPAVAPDVVPAGSLTSPMAYGVVSVDTTGGSRSVSATTLDSASPLTDGILTVLDGRLARAADEVAISPGLSEATAAAVGGELRLADGGPAYTVVGIAVDPDSTNDDDLFAQPGAVEFTPQDYDDSASKELLVGLPAGMDAIAVGEALNDEGIAVKQRAWLLNPPAIPYQDPAELALIIGLATITVGLALLQVVLLAGAAFAVGARRQRRALGLLAATGATGRDVGRTILAGGLVLGAIAALIGVAAGLLLAVPLRSIVEGLQGTLFGDWQVRWLEITAVAALGVVTGLVAALVPARAAARQDPLRALRQRPDPPRSGRRLTAFGLALSAAGLGVTVLGSSMEEPSYLLILGGAVFVELGFVLCAPALVGVAGRLAGPLPVPLRMALRDASRHRGRSGPAVAAVMAALAGCVAVSIFFVSQDEDAKRAYVPNALLGQVTLNYYDESDPLASPADEVLAVIEATLPTSDIASWQQVGPTCTTPECSGYLDWQAQGPTDVFPMAAVGGVDVLRAILGGVNETAEDALADGKVVFLDPAFVVDGEASFQTYGVDDDGAQTAATSGSAPAAAVRGPVAYSLALALMSEQTAESLDLAPQSAPTYLFDTSRMPTEGEVDRLNQLSENGTAFYFQVESWYESPAGPVLLALLGASVIVVLGATAISTGLAAADGRSDLATL
ncbi:MAG: FtsX-like permease family protein, partial [Geodermatophilaceae bacterium]|nr:FtsX-like permease family protein [Geodermatophilaceae bacterium]